MERLCPIDPLALQRYGALVPRRRFREEFRFRILRDLKGKNALDIGCGDGNNSVLLAKLGAQVTGLDISPKSIEFAHKKAEINGVRDASARPSRKWKSRPILSMSSGATPSLHHLLENLELVLLRLSLWAKPGALMLFSEPVNFNKALRRTGLRCR